MITIVDRNNKPINSAVYEVYSKVLEKLEKSGKLISDTLKFTTQRHFQTIYPNSKHYNPKKVSTRSFSNGIKTTGSINISVAGITRAYKNLTIRPTKTRALTIPIHRSAYGKRAGDFSDLFPINRKDGKSFLAKSDINGNLIYMFVLAKSAFQKRDKRLLPSDETFSKNIISRIKAYLQRTKI